MVFANTEYQEITTLQANNQGHLSAAPDIYRLQAVYETITTYYTIGNIESPRSLSLLAITIFVNAKFQITSTLRVNSQVQSPSAPPDICFKPADSNSRREHEYAICSTCIHLETIGYFALDLSGHINRYTIL